MDSSCLNIEDLDKLPQTVLRALAAVADISTDQSEPAIVSLVEKNDKGIPMAKDFLEASAFDGLGGSRRGAPSPPSSTTSSTDALECLRLLLYPSEDDSDVEPLSPHGSMVNKGKGKGRALTRSEDDEDPVSDVDTEGTGSGYSSPKIKVDKGKARAIQVSPCSSGYSDPATPRNIEARRVAGPSNSDQEAGSSPSIVSLSKNEYKWPHVENLLIKFESLEDFRSTVLRKDDRLETVQESETKTREARLLLDHIERMHVDTVLSLYRSACYRESLQAIYIALLQQYPEWRDGTEQLPQEALKMRMRYLRLVRYKNREVDYQRLCEKCRREGRPKPIKAEHVYYTTEESDVSTTPGDSDIEEGAQRNMRAAVVEGGVCGSGKKTKRAGRASAPSTMPVTGPSSTRISRARTNGHVASAAVPSAASGHLTGKSKGRRAKKRKFSDVEDDSEANGEDESASRDTSSKKLPCGANNVTKVGGKKGRVIHHDHKAYKPPNKRARRH